MPETNSKSIKGKKRAKKIKLVVKTQREQTEAIRPMRPQVSKLKVNRQGNLTKLNKTSVIHKNEEKSTENIISNLPYHKKNNLPTNTERKLPQIYQPQPNSTKILSIDKAKIRSNSTNEAIETRKTEKLFTERRKVEYQRKSVNFKLAQLQPMKQLNKQEKNQIFKIIRGEFQDLINSTNHLSMKNKDSHFRAYVERGNNGLLIKQHLKKRWWWHIEERDPQKANLIWTQWLNKAITEGLEDIEGEDGYYHEEYRSRNSEEIKGAKESSIKKIVDDSTFTKLQEKINFSSNNYFKNYKNSQSFCFSKQEEVKAIKANTNQIIHNHVDGCLHLHSKKLLYLNLFSFIKGKSWDPHEFIPLTFYIDRTNSPVIQELLATFEKMNEDENSKNLWICKPGQNSNRGHGITVVNNKSSILREIRQRLGENDEHFEKTVIFQKYIENCFLIQNRKFDIRCFILLTTVNGILKGYWYRDGYIRTSSYQYSLTNIENSMIHLTNDAIQKKSQSFGKYQDCNKMTFEGFKKYLSKVGEKEQKFDETYEKMKTIAYYMIASVSSKIKRKQFTFELFGLDYMLDDNLKPYLIEANSNPSLENTGKIMGSLIYHLVDNVIMTALDPIFPPPSNVKKPTENIPMDYFEWNRMQLIFSSRN